MLFEMLVRYWLRCYLTCWSRCCLMIWWGCQKAAFNAETVRRTGEFAVLSESCTWHWGSQMRWRIDDTRNAAFNIDAVGCTDDSCFFFPWRRLGEASKICMLAAGYVGWKFRLQSKDWLIDANRQDRRGVRNLLLAAKYVSWNCKATFDCWNDAGRQTNMRTGEASKICMLTAEYVGWKFRLQCKVWLIDADRQIGKRSVGFADNAAMQKKKSSTWSMFFWESCQKADLMNADRRAKTEYWLISRQHRSWFFLKRVPSCCRVNKIDRDFFWNAYRSNCQQVDQIGVFLRAIMGTVNKRNKAVRNSSHGNWLIDYFKKVWWRIYYEFFMPSVLFLIVSLLHLFP